LLTAILTVCRGSYLALLSQTAVYCATLDIRSLL